jgi:hypothetical protein
MVSKNLVIPEAGCFVMWNAKISPKSTNPIAGLMAKFCTFADGS